MEILKEKIPKHIYQRLEAAEIYSLDYFLIKSKRQICDKTRLSSRDVTSLIDIVSEIILNQKIVTAHELRAQESQWKILKTGCSIIDKTINGIPTRGITEIYGESGSGKTQLALQLALQVQKLEKYGGLNAGNTIWYQKVPGLWLTNNDVFKKVSFSARRTVLKFFDTTSYSTQIFNVTEKNIVGAIYICTEDSFPSKRLQQMSEFLPKSSKNNQEKSFSDEIFIEHIQDIEQLKYNIAIRVPVLLSKTKIKLIIIDSIAAVFRYDNETSDYISRSDDLKQLATNLNSLVAHYNIAVVCINQVTSDPKIGEKPCLGLSWSNLIRKRIKLHRCNTNTSYHNQTLPRRNLKVIFSPETPTNQCSFVITASGLLGFQ